jgi:hypothetical protein
MGAPQALSNGSSRGDKKMKKNPLSDLQTSNGAPSTGSVFTQYAPWVGKLALNVNLEVSPIDRGSPIGGNPVPVKLASVKRMKMVPQPHEWAAPLRGIRSLLS